MTDVHPISRFPVPKLSALPDDIQLMIAKVNEKSGFIPNVFLALAHRPDELRAFMAYHDALLLRDSNLSPSDKEMIIVATSGSNNCLYCVVAHGAILRIRAKDPLIADKVATNYKKADLRPRERAMLDFAMKVAHDSASIEEEDLDKLRAHGFENEDIWDIAGITSFFGLSNRMANFTSMRPNDEFYTLGR